MTGVPARWTFRMGAATGEISEVRRADRESGGLELAETPFGRAVHLEAAGRPGELLIDSSTFEGLTEADRERYPFSNTFALLTLGPCTEADATDFVTLRRLGLPPFTPEGQSAILAFARGHLLALQVACWHIVGSRPFKESLATVLRKANDPLETIRPGWRGRPA